MSKATLKVIGMCLLVALALGGCSGSLIYALFVTNTIKLAILFDCMKMCIALLVALIIYSFINGDIKEGKYRHGKKKVYLILCIVAFVFFVGKNIVDITDLAKDLEVDKEQNYEVVTGYLDSPKFSMPSKTSHEEPLKKAKIGDVKLRFLVTDIRTEEEFKEKL